MYRKVFFLVAFMAFLLTACRINTPPTINEFSANPSNGSEPLITTFTASVTDPDGDSLKCIIDFGDG